MVGELDWSGVDAKVAELMHEVAGRMREEFPFDVLIGRVREDVPQLAALPADVGWLEQTAEMIVEPLFEQIDGALDGSRTPAASPAAVEFARALARWGVEVEIALRAFGTAHGVGWRWIRRRIAQIVDDPHMRILVTERIEDITFAYQQTLMHITVEEYAAARDAATRGMLAQQLNIVREIVEGADVANAGALSARLGYDLALHHTGFVIWAEGFDDDAREHSGLEPFAREWLRELGFGHPLVVPVDGLTLWAWGNSVAPPGEVELAAPPNGVRVAVGQPAPGVQGFRDTHEEAVAARLLARRLELDAALITYAELDTIALLDQDPRRLRAYVRRKLGDLAAPADIQAAELRETLRVYLQSGERASVAAALGHLHRNTVTRRVAQATELRGRPLDDDRFGLLMALEIAAAYGDSVLNG